ncbi:hypothetical protein MVES_000620 [Malassezia vespertilionis]|uniref:Cytochrome b-c1 complex subunit Rieske, mitochondrial n=1 Tax=Malassezia vespertilionis TaxID=2020962 RepID=A0A2N1JGV8_9BASI|nr:hypothetical protein MVES_000620 [Malassezia vespertilionis]
MPVHKICRNLVSRKVTNLQTFAYGGPYVPGINLKAVASADPHDEHSHGPRADLNAAPRWTSRSVVRGNTLFSTTRVNVEPAGVRVMPVRNFSSSTRALDAPDFNAYRVKNTDVNRAFSYFMVGTFGAIAASSARSTVTNFLSSMSASSDVLALAKVEVDMGNIPLGKNAIIKWRGKPIFVRHRTEDEIKEAESVDVAKLRDPQEDADRVKRAEWLVMVGVCTHLGCVPIGEAGEYDGWFCPCHGSHYDISGRIRKGPAPLNLEVPEYDFNDGENKTNPAD